MNLNLNVDKTLLEQAEAGDLTSLGKLTEHFRPVLTSLAQKNIDLPSQAEDIVGDTMVVAMGEFESRDKKTPFAAWLLNIFYLVSLTYFELDTKLVYLEEEDFKELVTEGIIPEVVDKHFEQIGNKHKIWQSLQNLEEISRSAIILYYFAEITSPKQVAQILDIPENEVKNTLSKARQELSVSLKTPLQA